MILCRILGPYKFYVDPDDWSISPHLMLDGLWEQRVTEAIVDRLQPGMTAIDVGANVGYFSMLMAALVGETGRVMAFEPNPAAANRLEASLAINGFTNRAVVYAEPLGDDEGMRLVLNVPDHHPGGVQRAWVEIAGSNQIIAHTRRLDRVPGALAAALVKIDTEGMEESVWRGMSTMIAGAALRFVVIEFSTSCYEGNGAVLIDQAIAAGFALHRIDDRIGVVATSRAEILAELPVRGQMMLLLER